jgi:hypothetical protein
MAAMAEMTASFDLLIMYFLSWLEANKGLMPLRSGADVRAGGSTV